MSDKEIGMVACCYGDLQEEEEEEEEEEVCWRCVWCVCRWLEREE